MAIDSTMVWEVRATGSDTNGGGFKPGASGTDWSQQNSPQYSVTDAVTNGTTTITSATANFGTDVVGNALYIAGGTGSITGTWKEITVRNSSTSITVDSSTGLTTGTGATLHIGGALGSPGQLGAVETAGNTAWFKGSFTIISASVNVSGGVLKDVVGGIDSLQPLHWEGYGTTRGDKVRATFTLQNSLTASAIWIIDYEGAAKKYTYLDSINVDAGTGNSNAGGIHLLTNSQYVTRCKVSNTTAIGIQITDQYQYVCDVEVAGFSGTAGIRVNVSADLQSYLMRATVHDGSAPGIDSYQAPLNFGDLLIYNISNGGTGTVPGAGLIVDLFSKITNATIYNCATDGVYIIGHGGGYILGMIFTNVVVYGSGAYGWKTEETEGVLRVRLLNCAGGSNASGNYDSGITSVSLENFIALSADPFTNAAGGDFSLSTTAAGTSLRTGGVPGALGSTTTGHTAIGAAQPSASGGGQIGYPL